MIILVQCLMLLLVSLYLYCWVAVSNDYVIFNKSLYEHLGFWFNWTTLILYLTAFVFLVQALLLGSCILNIKFAKRRIKCANLFAVATAIIATIGYGVIAAIWRPELQTVKLFFSLTWPYLHAFALILSIIFICFKVFWIRDYCTTQFLVFYCCYYIILLLIPNVLISPCIKDNIYDLPKPLIFGHKGNPKFAPENTLLSFQEANDANVDGYEADVAVSMDGIPFLIHDVTLRRTSDVADVFPDRQYRAAEAFKLIELKQLNAGKWFLHQNPYGTVHSLSKSKKDKIMRQKIMSLLDLANLAKLNNKMLIFDLRMPRDWGNPHIQDYIPIIVETVLKSGIDQSKVMWISGPMNEYVMNVAPGFVQVYGAETNARNIIARKIKMLILEYNTLSERLILHYKDMYNISIISYTSSAEWTYSLAWCQGAYAVISDDPKMHRDLTKPIFASTPHEYHVLWVSTYILCCVISMLAILRSRKMFDRNR